jgi:hypothetical protein
MFAFTTSDVYITLMYKFESYSIKFSRNYLSMALYKQCYDVFNFREITIWLPMALNKQL